MKKLRMGIIGFGKSAGRYHLPYIRQRENIEVAMIYNHREKQEMTAYCTKNEINWTTDLNVLLQDKSIELVSIITPPKTHFETVKQALLAGKHVICEKPFVQTTTEAKELIDLANEKGLMLMPFQNRRFDGDFLAAVAAIKRGVLGRLIEFECHFDYFRESDEVIYGDNIEGSVYGHAVHLIDRAIAIFGRPKKVFCDVKNVRTGVGLDDYHDIHLFYDNGFKVIVRSHYLVALSFPQFIIHGSRGSFIKYGIDQQETDLKAGMKPGELGFGVDNIKNHAVMKYLNQNNEWVERELPTPIGDYGRFYDAVYETIVNGAPKLISDDEILTVLKILEGCFTQVGPHIFEL